MSVMRTELPRDLDQAAAGFEGEIREFVRKDVSRKARPEMPRAEASRAEMPRSDNRRAEAGHNPTRDQINNVLRGVCGASMEEIDRVILELQGVRDMLRSEGERVQRELAGYASLNQAALTAMKIIAESLTQWKAGPSARQDSH